VGFLGFNKIILLSARRVVFSTLSNYKVFFGTLEAAIIHFETLGYISFATSR
jgi:hypothetical protein